MAEALKSFFSRSLVKELASEIAAVHPPFPSGAFIRDATAGLEDLELLARSQHIAHALEKHLPADYEDAVAILLRSLGSPHASDELLGAGMTPFFYMPHTMFVSTYGLDAFDTSMKAQHQLTQRFTCEFSIRPFLARHPERTFATLARWAKDKSPHVRRLVSEGTRPRLPWGSRVKWIDENPTRLLTLLEQLKDDPATVVRRSVANHLNDLYRTQPALACDVAERWLDGASPERRALVKHALRSAVKKGDARALGLLGFGGKANIEIERATFSPKKVAIGESVRVAFTVASKAKRTQALAVDLVVHFVKSSGKPSPKVFKVAQLSLGAGERADVGKTISLAVHTTRKPFAGEHAVEAAVNGARFPLGSFRVTG